MKIRKDYLKLSLIILGLVIVATVGFNTWNNQIMPSLGSLEEFSIYLILGFAFFAGVISFFSPCGIALLPAFISYNMLMVKENANPQKSKFNIKLLKIGVFSALGIASFYIILGIVFSLLGSVISPYIKTLQYIVAFLFILFGFMIVKKFTLRSGVYEKFRSYITSKAMSDKGYKGFYFFGFAYGLDIIGCLFPLILVMILIPIATGDLVTGISAFVSYSIALGVTLTIFAYLISSSKNTLVSDIMHSTKKIHKFAGIGLMIGGSALIIYYVSPFAMNI